MGEGAIEAVKRLMMVAATLFLLLSALAFNSPMVVKSKTNEASFIIKTSVTYYNNGTENWVFTDEDRAIGLFMNNTWQTVNLTYRSHPLELDVDDDGNPIAFLEFPKTEIEPGENMSYAVTYYALSKPRLLPDIREEDSRTLDDIPEELIERYCGESDPWLVDDSELQDLAYDITNGETKVLTIVKKFITWIRDNVRYDTQDTPRYPNETYTERKGDCDDQAILFITLCRILEIPSYLQIGCIYLPTHFDDSEYWNGHVKSVLKRIGWHGWAIVYVPPWRWLPVDLTYVIGGFGDPLNAIKKGAVTSQTTLQYMNISQTDYAASSRLYRDFLKNNHFYVYAQDEMTRMLPESPLHGIIEKLFPWILVTTIVVVAVIITTIFVWTRREKRLKETEFKHDSSYES